jgi:hypothetical protein
MTKSEGGEFRPKILTAFSRAVLRLFGRPESAHTHDDVISSQRITRCSL